MLERPCMDCGSTDPSHWLERECDEWFNEKIWPTRYGQYLKGWVDVDESN